MSYVPDHDLNEPEILTEEEQDEAFNAELSAGDDRYQEDKEDRA
jgi:hypothetical protein